MQPHQLANPHQQQPGHDKDRQRKNRPRPIGHVRVLCRKLDQAADGNQNAKRRRVKAALFASIIRQHQRRAGILGFRKDTPAQPDRKEDDKPECRQDFHSGAPLRPQHGGQGKRLPQGQYPQGRQDELAQRQEKGPYAEPADRTDRPHQSRQPVHQGPATQDQGKGDDKVQGGKGKVAFQIAPRQRFVPLLVDFGHEGGAEFGDRLDRVRPMHRIERGRCQFHKLIGLPFAQLAVDFLDQPVGPPIGLIRSNDRGLQPGQLIAQLGPPHGKAFLFHRAFGRRCPQGIKLPAQRGDARRIHVLRGKEGGAPFRHIAAHLGQRLVWRGAVLGLAFGPGRRPFPGLVIRWPGFLNCCGRRGFRPGHPRRIGLCPNGRRGPAPDKHQRQQQRRDQAEKTHESSKTAGIVRGAASSQPGTGSPFSFRNSGL